MRKKLQKGFTLIELTIVMGIFIVIGTIIVTILNSTFQGNTKARVTNDMSQNGNYALSIITNLLLNSQRFDGIVVTSPACTPSESETCCSATGTTGKSITVTGLDGGTTTLTCQDSGANPLVFKISSNSASLIDVNQVVVSPGSCSFTCTQVDEYSPPRIDIAFTLRNTSGNTSANFRTSVSLRNQNLK